MKSINPLLSIAAATMLGSVFSSSAALVPIAGVTGHNGGQGHGEENGTLGEMIDQYGMDTTANGTPDDPASWLTPTNSWPDEWQSSALLDNEISANGKIGWAAVDLGSEVADLDNLFIWHNRENNQRFAASYNIYYATSPDVALPADPGSENSNGDYDFASGGWTQLGDLRTGTHQGNETVALDGITARYFAFEIITNNGHLDRVGFAEIAVTSGSVDTTPPTLASDDIVDDRGGASVSIDTPVTYTLSFSENIDETTVTDADFSNAGTSIITIGTITETTPGIFTVEVTATTEGTLQLQIPTGAVISDGSGINLDTSAAIVDDTTITVAVDLGAPTLSPDNIVDDQGGLAVQVNDLVIYTLAFSEDMDDSTVGPDDFANAGTASITIGAINETAPGVFSVSVAPITIGTLQLQIPSEAVLTDTAGNPLDTTSSIDDDTLIVVEEPTVGSGIIPINRLEIPTPVHRNLLPGNRHRNAARRQGSGAPT